MKFEITSDSSWECRVGETLQGMHMHEEFHHFLADDYGHGIPRIFVVLNCHPPGHSDDRRVFFDNPRRTLYLDVMLDFGLMRSGGELLRRKEILEKLGEDVPAVAARFASPTFDGLRFGRDFRKWVKNYPSFPIHPGPANTSHSRPERFTATNGEFRSMVLEEFAPIMSRWGLAFSSEPRGQNVHAILLQSDTKLLGIHDEVEPGAIAVQPMTIGESAKKSRMFILQYVKLAPDGHAPLELTTVANKNDTVVGLIELSRAGDVRVALRALADFFGSNPQVLFPGS